MILELRAVTVGDDPTPALPAVDAAVGEEAPSIVAVGTERGPLLASLIAGGRLVPDRGTVLLDGSEDADAIRRAVALVDTPVVAEPVPTLPVGSVVREELRFADLPSGRSDAAGLLAELGLARWYRSPISDLPPTDRIRLLLTLAAGRPGVRVLVLTSPERHGGPSAGWLGLAHEFTEAGKPVLVLGGHALDAVAGPGSPS